MVNYRPNRLCFLVTDGCNANCDFCGTVFSDEKATKLIVDEYESLKDANPKIVFIPNALATDELFAKVIHKRDGKRKRTPLVRFIGPLRKEDYDIARYNHDLGILEGIKMKGGLEEKQDLKLSEYIDQLRNNVEVLQEAILKN